MPIELSTPIRVVTQDEYHAIDRVMLGCAFEIHNEYGRLLGEEFYKRELTQRCRQVGLSVEREVRVRVSYGDFRKDYSIDLLLNSSVVTEGKCAQAITSAHRGQTLNYLLLSETHHASLLNFRPLKVKREFVSTQLTHDLRRRFTTTQHDWPHDSDHRELLDVANAFCADVGLGLDLTLYRQAFTMLTGTRYIGPQPVAILSRGRAVYEHPMHLVTDDVGLAVTAIPSLEDTRRHLQRLVNKTLLKGIAWINLPLNHLRFEFVARKT